MNALAMHSVLAQDCSMPQNPRVLEVGTTWARLSWPSTGASSYYVTSNYWDSDGINVTTSDTMVLVTGLEPQTRYSFFVASICTDGDTSYYAWCELRTLCLDTVPWGHDVGNGFCWTIEDSAWTTNQFYATIHNSATPAQHWLLTQWFEVPVWAANDPVGLVWKARAVKNADVMVLATTDGVTYDTLFDGLIYPADNNYSTSYTSNAVSHIALLDAYAGQVVRLAFVYQTGSSRFSLTTGYMRLDLIDFELRTVMHPVALLNAPVKAFTNEATRLTATLSEGSTSGLVFTWHSQLLDTTFTGDTMTVNYNITGVDSILMVASNIYGADTHWVVLPVYDCPPVTAKPWLVDWENDFDCWSQITGTAWSIGYYNSKASLYGESGHSGVIASPRVVIPTDTTGLRLRWKDKKWSSNVAYYVMVTTGDINNLSSYDTIGTFTADNSSSFVGRSVSLAAYAGDTVHIALRRNSGGNTLYIQDFCMVSDLMPLATLETPDFTVRAGDTVTYSLHLQLGSDSMLAFVWSSSMVQSGLGTVVAQDSVLKVVYGAEGRDTVSVTVSNAYGSMTLDKTLGVFVCDTVHTIPWEEEFVEMGSDASYDACWQFSGWSHVPAGQQRGFPIDDYCSMSKNDMMMSSGGENYLITPPIAVPDEGNEHLALWVHYNGLVTALLSTQGDSALSLFTDTLFVSDDNIYYTIKTVPLEQYAGQTVHVALLAHNSSKYIDRVAVDYDTLPVLNAITAPSKTRTDSTIVCSTSPKRGDTTGLTYTWHSSLTDTTVESSTPTITIYYSVGGIDTITVVATNGYGSDTVWTTVNVVDCTPATQLPWIETFAESDICWYKPIGSNWHVTYPSGWYDSYKALHSTCSADTVNHWIISKAISLPADASTMPTLFWDAAKNSNNAAYHPRYSVLVSSADDPADLSAYTVVYTDTVGLKFYGFTSFDYYTHRSASLTDYAGQTVYIAFCNQPVSGFTTELVVDNVTVRTAAEPVVTLSAPAEVNSHEPVNYTATLSEGNPTGLTYTWHSTLLDSTITCDSSHITLRYVGGGIDTVKVTAINGYGADTASAVVNVIDCTPIAILPWMEDFSGITSRAYNASGGEVPNCWHRYWNGSNASFAPHVIGNYLSQTAIHAYSHANNALLLMAGSQNGYDSIAIVESPVFNAPLGNRMLSLFYMFENASFGALSVGYMQDSAFISIADVAPCGTGCTDTMSLEEIPDEARRFALRWEWSGSGCGVIVDSVCVFQRDTLPSVRVVAPRAAFVGDTATFEAVLRDGLTEGLSYTWHSSLTGMSWVTGNLDMVYDTEGVDTMMLVASNAYGSDTAWAVVNVGSHPLPQVSLTAPTQVLIPGTAVYSVSLNDCSQNGLVLIWHSTLLDSTISMGSSLLTLDYSTQGIDTLTVVASNAYGADTAEAVVEVVDCNGYALPYSEDFAGITPVAWNTAGSNMPHCWQSSLHTSMSNTVGPNVVSSYSYIQGLPSNVLLLVAGTSSNNVYSEWVQAALPGFGVQLQSLLLSFDYRFESVNRGTLTVGYCSDTTYIVVDTLAPHSGSFQNAVVSFAELDVPADAHIALRFACSGTYYAVAIDNISVQVDGGIHEPRNLRVDSLGAQCIGLSWSPVDSAVAYRVTVDDVVDTVVGLSNVALCGLSPNTTYTAFVNAIGNGDTSISASVTFTTLCHIVSLPWMENFEVAGSLQCWSTLGIGNVGLMLAEHGSYYTAFFHSGIGGMRINNDYYSSTQSVYAVSPLIEAPGDELLVSFWASHFDDGANSVEAGVLTVPGDTASFVPITVCHLSSSPTRFEFDTRGLTSAFVSLAFRLRGSTTGLVVDDIAVEHLTPCARVRGVTSYPTGPHSATLQWQYDALSSIPNTGVLITLTDMNDSNAAAVVVNAAGNSHTFTDLTSGHRYQARVRTLCQGDTSEALFTAVVPSGNVCAERSDTTTNGYITDWSVTNCDRPYTYSQALYPAVMAATIDTLFGIAYRITSTNVEQYPSGYDTYSDRSRLVDVYIGQTSADTLTAPVSASNLTLAVQNYEMPVDRTGWVRINFTNPVPLDGVSNLIVTVDDNTGVIYGFVNFAHHFDDVSAFFQTSSANYDYIQTYNPYYPSSFGYTGRGWVPDIQLLGGCADDRCLQPLVIITDEDTHSVSLGWQQRGIENQWLVEYKIEGDVTWMAAGTTPDTVYTISGLNASTAYRVRVAALCTGDTIYSDEHRVHTSCGVVNLPYYQTFRADYMSNFVSSMTNAIPCWNTGDIPVLSQNRGLWNTHRNGDFIVSPEMGTDMAGLKVTLSASGSTFFLSGIKVGVCADDGSNLQWIDTITLNDNAQTYTVYMSAYTGAERHIAIGGSYEAWTLYDVTVVESNTCQSIHHLDLQYVDDTSAVVSWMPVSYLSHWAIYVDDSLVGISQDTLFAIGGLTPGTSYTVGVSEICWAYDTAVATTKEITTLCSTPLPWSENFDGGVNFQVPACWYPIFRLHIGNVERAYILGANDNPYLYFHDSYSPYDDVDHDTVANFLCSPVINAGSRAVDISFSARKSSSYGVFQAGVMSNPADTSSFVPLITLNQYSANMIPFQFSTDSLDLPSKFCLAFRSWGESTSMVDDINVAFVPLPSHVISATVNDTLMGNVSGEGTYEEGSVATLTAVPNEGYHFVMWDDSTTAPVRTVRVTADMTFMAYFAADSVPPVVPDTVWRSVVVSANVEGVCNPYGSGVYADSSMVEIGFVVLDTLADDGHWHFQGWSDGDATNPRSIMVICDTLITALFEWVTDSTVGIINSQLSTPNSQLTVYPNPATSTVTIDGLEPGARLTVMDMSGRRVDDFTVGSQRLVYDVSRLPRGAYFIRSMGLAATKTAKLILQ